MAGSDRGGKSNAFSMLKARQAEGLRDDEPILTRETTVYDKGPTRAIGTTLPVESRDILDLNPGDKLDVYIFGEYLLVEKQSGGEDGEQ